MNAQWFVGRDFVYLAEYRMSQSITDEQVMKLKNALNKAAKKRGAMSAYISLDPHWLDAPDGMRVIELEIQMKISTMQNSPPGALRADIDAIMNRLEAA